MHLCSAFSNLLDNAIRAAEPLAPRKPVVDISARIKNDMLMIKAENPFDKAIPGKQGSRLGHKILKEIAQQYGGELLLEPTETQFIAILALQLPTPPQAAPSGKSPQTDFAQV